MASCMTSIMQNTHHFEPGRKVVRVCTGSDTVCSNFSVLFCAKYQHTHNIEAWWHLAGHGLVWLAIPQPHAATLVLVLQRRSGAADWLLNTCTTKCAVGTDRRCFALELQLDR